MLVDLAEKYNKDPNIWTNNVDSCILNLSDKEYYRDPVVYNGYVRGAETYNFVEDIMSRYKIYKDLINNYGIRDFAIHDECIFFRQRKFYFEIM